jgi:predicted nucleotidyltransferase
MSPVVEQITKKILPILKNHHVFKAGIFGSAIRGEMGAKSDVDILVEIPGDISLLEFAGIKIELEEALGRKVDLVEYAAIKAVIKESIMKEQVSIL